MANFSLSPSVKVKEQSFDAVIPTIASTGGALAGAFQWGVVEDITTISSENKLVTTFGKPDDIVANSWFTCANMLAYGNNLKIVRMVGDYASNASDDTDSISESFTGDGTLTDFALVHEFDAEPSDIDIYVDDVLQEETTDYTTAFDTDTLTVTFLVAPVNEVNIKIRTNKFIIKNYIHFQSSTALVANVYAKYPSTMANGLEIVVANNTNWATLTDSQKALFTTQPSTTEISVAIIDNGKFVNEDDVLWIRNLMSTNSDATASDGSSDYYKEIINRTCPYVYVTATGTLTSATSIILTGGEDDNELSDAKKIEGYNLFKNQETVDFRFLMGVDANSTVAIHLINNIAEYRKDCVVLLSPTRSSLDTYEEGIITFKNTLPSSSYYLLDGNWKYQYDRYNDTYRWLPLNGDTAGLCSRTAENNEPWFSPAGYNRGLIKNTIKLFWNPDKTQRDELYKNNINPIITENGQGTLLFGDKTGLTKPSSFDRINVRMLFIILEKAIATSAKYTLFEFNDEFTRNSFINKINQYLRAVKGRRGIEDFEVKCDRENNTDDVINNNGFVAQIKIRPTKSINFIELQFASVDFGIEFSEIG